MSIHWEDKMLEQVSPRLEIQLISTDGHDNDNLARRLAQHAELQVRMCIYMREWGGSVGSTGCPADSHVHVHARSACFKKSKGHVLKKSKSHDAKNLRAMF